MKCGQVVIQVYIIYVMLLDSQLSTITIDMMNIGIAQGMVW